MSLVVMKRVKDLSRSSLYSLPKMLTFTHHDKSSTGKYS